MDRTRHLADSEVRYQYYFDHLHSKIKEYNLEAKNLYNMDEKGFLMGLTGRSKRVFSKRMWTKKEVRASLQDGSREFLTLMAATCADESWLPPVPMDHGYHLASSTLRRMAPSHQSGWRISRQENVRCLSPLLQQADLIMISVQHGLSRYSTAALREEQGSGGYLSLMAMDLISRWNSLSIVITTRSFS
jgi:hypothetical protein